NRASTISTCVIGSSALFRSVGYWPAFYDAETVTVQTDDILLAVRQQNHVPDAKVEQNLRTNAIVAQFTAGAFMFQPRVNRIGQGRGARFADQHDNAAPDLRDLLHGGLKLAALAAAPVAQHIVQHV